MAAKPPAPPKSRAKPKRPAKPSRPANLPRGRWLGDFEPLSKVERQLVAHCARGEPFVLGTEPPEKPLVANRIRAGIIRFLLIGGDGRNPIHENGVMVRGAWVQGEMNLNHARCLVRLEAEACRFDRKIVARETRIPALSLTNCSIPSLMADGIRVTGDVELGDKFATAGEVRLLGAEIGGDLNCDGGHFSNKNGIALAADGIRVKGSVFLSEKFAATGEVRLLEAEIAGALACVNGSFSNKDAKALNLGGATIQALFLRRGLFVGKVDLTAASVGKLVDDEANYEDATLFLDGFRYDRIIGSTVARKRIEWLKDQAADDLGSEFKPQPWEQLIKVLREMGHPAEAAEIAMEKQTMLRRARKVGRRQTNPKLAGWRMHIARTWVRLANTVARGLHRFYGWIAGYGHRPSRIVLWMLAVCSLCSLGYYYGRDRGLIGPSAPVFLLHPRLAHCGTGGDLGKVHWTSPDCPVPPEYSTFQPFFYSLDVIIPFVDLHQEADWGPVVTNRRGETLWWGRVLRWAMWFEIIFGWLASVMFVAIVGRLVDKD